MMNTPRHFSVFNLYYWERKWKIKMGDVLASQMEGKNGGDLSLVPRLSPLKKGEEGLPVPRLSPSLAGRGWEGG